MFGFEMVREAWMGLRGFGQAAAVLCLGLGVAIALAWLEVHR